MLKGRRSATLRDAVAAITAAVGVFPLLSCSCAPWRDLA
jgi:hypothetical protein